MSELAITRWVLYGPFCLLPLNRFARLVDTGEALHDRDELPGPTASWAASATAAAATGAIAVRAGFRTTKAFALLFRQQGRGFRLGCDLGNRGRASRAQFGATYYVSNPKRITCGDTFAGDRVETLDVRGDRTSGASFDHAETVAEWVG